MQVRLLPLLFGMSAALLGAPSLSAQQQQPDWDAVQIRVEQVADGVYVLFGQGGNIGLSVGADGAFVIDDQFAPLTDKIRAAIATVTDQPVRFVINTHWHGDHTGGNENFGGTGSLIVAHENVRRRMNPAEFTDVIGRTEQAPAAALPVVTFTDAVTFYWNGQKIEVQHVEPAHTDGDSIIWFTEGNVVHMGDNFFVGRYPFIDVDSGGSVNGMIAAADIVLARGDEGTRVIPGHGPVTTPADLAAFRDLLVTVRERVQTLIADGKTVEEVLAAAPTAQWDAAMTGGAASAERFVRAVYVSLTQ